jgi:hypothetical protein
MEGLPNMDVHHSSEYLFHKSQTIEASGITVVGSGQSAAEAFLDLLEDQKANSYNLTWFARSQGIFQLESSKLGQEFFATDYVDYFHKLPLDKRLSTLDQLDQLRKGINQDTLHQIYETYASSSDMKPTIRQFVTYLGGGNRKTLIYFGTASNFDTGMTISQGERLRVWIDWRYKESSNDWYAWKPLVNYKHFGGTNRNYHFISGQSLTGDNLSRENGTYDDIQLLGSGVSTNSFNTMSMDTYS